MNQEELVSELIKLREREKEIRKALNQLEFDEKYARASKYIGKFYIETGRCSIRSVHVHGINPETSDLRAICVNYWEDNEDSYFGIEDHHYFKPWDQDSIFNWKETTKDEYLKHYEEVQRRIKKTLP